MSWSPLPFEHSESVNKNAPPFLVSVSFSSFDYSVSITDLTYCWKEDFDRKSIIRRSIDQNTSIDPSEDAQQMRLFLNKVHQAFIGDEDTSLRIKAIKSEDGNETPDLEIEVTATLPKPLLPLIWTMHLKLLPHTAVTEKITLPLVKAQNKSMKEIEYLLDVLKEKDHVIQKLVDKLEASGTDLGQVFPGASSRGGRTVSRQVAEEKVKGLGPFNRIRWREAAVFKDPEENERAMVTGLAEKFMWNLGQSDQDGGWWGWLDQSKKKALQSVVTDRAELKEDTKPAPKVPTDAGDETDDEDDFQVQATPPRQKSPTKKEPPPQPESDDDEDDLDGPSQRSVSQRSVIPDSVPIDLPLQQSSKPKKMGAIGGIKKPTKAHSPSPSSPNSPPPTKAGQDAMSVDQDTATEDEDSIPSRPKSPPAKPKIGLGKIGGKKKEPTPVVAESPSPVDPVKESPAPEKKVKAKLGQIGKKAKATETPTVAEEDEDDRGRAAAKEKTPPPRETSLERADRKRLELKRQLEEKAKAPGKKKRKF